MAEPKTKNLLESESTWDSVKPLVNFHANRNADATKLLPSMQSQPNSTIRFVVYAYCEASVGPVSSNSSGT